MTALLTFACLLALPGPAADNPRARAIAPFVVGDDVAVAHADLAKLDVPSLGRSLLGNFAREEEVDEFLQGVGRLFGALRRAGVSDLYLIANPIDFPGPPVAVVPLADGADATAIGRL